jgi:predicted ATPase
MRHLFDQKTKLYPHQEQALLKLHDLAVKGELNPKRSQGRKSAFLLIGVGCGKTVILREFDEAIALLNAHRTQSGHDNFVEIT